MPPTPLDVRGGRLASRCPGIRWEDPAGYPLGVSPTLPHADRLVMRVPHRVRVWKSKSERCSRIMTCPSVFTRAGVPRAKHTA